MRVDSLYLTAAFYNTSSNTRLGVVYSLSHFTTDSTDVTSIPGGFANPLELANQTEGPTNRYALALAGPEGLTLAPGQILTVRLYFSCSSSSAGHYALLKDVRFTGLARESTVANREPFLPASSVRLFPNPAGDNLTLEHPVVKTPALVAIFTARGIHLKSVRCRPNAASTHLPLADLPAGIYYAVFRNDRGMAAKPFFKH